jgi:hypothetical protein
MIYGRAYFIKSITKTPEKRTAIKGEYIAILLTWGTLFFLSYNSMIIYDILHAWTLPWFFAGCFQSVRKLTEHLGLAGMNAYSGTRTVIPKTLFQRFTFWLNLEIFRHGIHHYYASKEFFELKSIIDSSKLKPEDQTLFFPTYISSVLNMLPHLLNPGVGVNASSSYTKYD